jgi:hypothetical protein
MSTDSRSESPVVQFFDSFLQEKNIKWILSAGMLILLGSSLKMVTGGWDDFPSTYKFLIIVGYTAAIFGSGHWSYHNLGLRKTGTSLLALTVLLIPVSFMAWHWVWDSPETTMTGATAIGLLLLNTVVAAFASRRTFRHFLQGDQHTFVASYLALSLAGAIAPTIAELGAVWSWLGSAVLWTVFSVGVVKVNRHVFWLTEEHRRPRIFGFFPILLLGMQFLLVFGANFAITIDSDWFGFGCVLVAVPMLLTADTVAKVFQERTGNLVRPIPWPIMLSLTVGLILCAVGIGLAGSGIVDGTPYALVPTAAAAAILMAVAARRTGKSAFVWAMLTTIVLAYNFSPVFFQERARQVIEHGAQAVSEEELPYAFYGLTYLPLILSAMFATVTLQRRKNELFARPLRQFCVGLSLLLLAASFWHVKALLPVAGVMIGVFATQAGFFQDRLLALAAIGAFLIASVGLVPFAERVFELALIDQMHYVVPTIAAALLLVASPMLDRRIASLPLGIHPANSPLWEAMCRTTSLFAAICVGVVWLTRFGTSSTEPTLLATLLIAGVLAVHSWVWLRNWVTWIAYLFVASELIRFGITEMSLSTLSSLGTLLLGVQWISSYVFDRFPQHRMARAFGAVNQTSALFGLLGAMLFIAIPAMAAELLWNWGQTDSWLFWARGAFLAAWCFDAARRPERIFGAHTHQLDWRLLGELVPAFLGCIGVLGLVGCGLIKLGGSEAIDWLPLAWTATALVALPLSHFLQRRMATFQNGYAGAEDHRSVRAIAAPLDAMMWSVFGAFATWQLFVYTTPIRIAGYAALGGMLILAITREKPILRTATAAVLNWTILLHAIHFAVGTADNAYELLTQDVTSAYWIVAALASVSTLGWQLPRWQSGTGPADLALVQRWAMRLVGFGALLSTMSQHSTHVANLALACLAFGTFCISELLSAVRYQDEKHVWTAQAVIGAAVGYFFWFHVISFGRGISMFVVLSIGLVLYVAGLLAARRDDTKLFARPFLITGLWMPLVAVGIGIFRHFAYDYVVWHGMNSLAILLAGGFYFWQAIERRSKGFAVLSAVILNVAISLLWNELGRERPLFQDPQFYMIPIGISILFLVEILKRELPAAWHNPLRYAGALTILVSPTFHILSNGSWGHMITLMIASTAVLLISIGLRIRALMYTGTAFLIADLVGMVIRGGQDNPNVLWIAGIAFGAAVVLLGAYCEHNREKLLQRMRILSAQMEHWS